MVFGTAHAVALLFDCDLLVPAFGIREVILDDQQGTVLLEDVSFHAVRGQMIWKNDVPPGGCIGVPIGGEQQRILPGGSLTLTTVSGVTAVDLRS